MENCLFTSSSVAKVLGSISPNSNKKLSVYLNGVRETEKKMSHR